MDSNAIIQYSSSSSSSMNTTYEVFVSFRGDTRNNFTDHLFGALRRKGIHFFKDDTKLQKGKLILPELMQAIEGSQVLVVVFSKEYASSKWCLRELVKISDYIDVFGKHVLPIFYDVTPSEVRYQIGNYKNAFDKYEERFKDDKEKMEEVLRWRNALSQVANLFGWDIGNKPQDAEIEKIVQYITKVLGQNISSLSNDDLIGMESRVKELEKLLLLGSTNVVRVLGICGMPGIGKTTLVTALWERIHHYFEFHCFIDDVSKIFQDSNTLGIQKQILCQALDDNNLKIYNIFMGTNLVRTRLRHRRGFIVLDNVDHIDQLDKLALDHTCLGVGSRMIIISRDEHILHLYNNVHHIYHVQQLNEDHASQLFCKYAFKDNYIMSDYRELKRQVLSYVQGHPLAIKVLGSFLSGRDILQWRSALARLREKPNKDIMEVLRVSFDALEENEKKIFLDIACFISWYKQHDIMEVLHFRGFKPEIGLNLLLEKSLITISNKRWVEMHPLLIDLGKCIVQEKSPKKPREWSRLWSYQDLHKVMLENKSAKSLEAIVVDWPWPKYPHTTMMADALSKMRQIKLLILEEVEFSGNLNDLSNKLAYLTWKKYPFKCLPRSFQPDNLVELFMCHSNIKRLWKGKKSLPNLRRLDLSGSKNLIEMPDFGGAPNLELLDFSRCVKLRKIHPSIGFLRKLLYLNLKNCKNILSLPISLLGLNYLEYLNLFGCLNMYDTQLLEPRDAKHFKKLRMGEAPIHSQSVSRLLPGFSSFRCMRELNLSFCNLFKIPDSIGNLCCLQGLNLMGNNFKKIPNLKKLSKLLYIDLKHCKQLKYLSELPSQIDMMPKAYIPPIEPFIYFRTPGVHIFNCPEFVESERCTSMTISWMLPIIKIFHHRRKALYCDVETACIESVIPGSEIPRWFNNQHLGMGSSISVDASPLMQHGNNWVGIVFCVVFVVPHKKESILKMSYQEIEGAISHCIHVRVNGVLVTDESDHMALFYYTRRDFIGACKRSRTFGSGDIVIKLNAEVSSWDYLQVKKYGYHWVYGQDLQLSNISMKHSKSSSKWKHKF